MVISIMTTMIKKLVSVQLGNTTTTSNDNINK